MSTLCTVDYRIIQTLYILFPHFYLVVGDVLTVFEPNIFSLDFLVMFGLLELSQVELT